MSEVKDWRSNKRISKLDIPNTPMKCGFECCPHRGDSMCANPRENKRKDDAACHKIGNKDFVAIFNLTK